METKINDNNNDDDNRKRRRNNEEQNKEQNLNINQENNFENNNNIKRRKIESDSEDITNDKPEVYSSKKKENWTQNNNNRNNNNNNNNKYNSKNKNYKKNENEDYETPTKPKKLFRYGNYDRYYGYRNVKGNDDPRVQAFSRSWFEGKRVLDVGCNVGFVTLAVAQLFNPSHITGVDIDADLISKAETFLQSRKEKQISQQMRLLEIRKEKELRLKVKNSNEQEINNESMIITSIIQDDNNNNNNNQKDKEENEENNDEENKINENRNIAINDLQTAANHPFNIRFYSENFVATSNVTEHYDTILCLSVTKWIHLNWGDEGIVTLFTKIYNSLNAGGMLILEPQAWKTYKKKARMCSETFENFKKIQIRPHAFEEYLLQKVGFTSVEVLRPTAPKHGGTGFDRPILIFHKQ